MVYVAHVSQASAAAFANTRNYFLRRSRTRGTTSCGLAVHEELLLVAYVPGPTVSTAVMLLPLPFSWRRYLLCVYYSPCERRFAIRCSTFGYTLNSRTFHWAGENWRILHYAVVCLAVVRYFRILGDAEFHGELSVVKDHVRL